MLIAQSSKLGGLLGITPPFDDLSALDHPSIARSALQEVCTEAFSICELALPFSLFVSSVTMHLRLNTQQTSGTTEYVP